MAEKLLNNNHQPILNVKIQGWFRLENEIAENKWK
jgi:hypothetical protein